MSFPVSPVPKNGAGVTFEAQAVVASEFLIRDAIRDGVQTFVDEPALVDKLFKGYTEEVITEIKAYLSVRTGAGKFPLQIVMNYPTEGISIPFVAIVLAADQEDPKLDFLSNYIETDIDDAETVEKEVVGTANNVSYNIMIGSQYPNLTLYLYTIIKAILILKSDEFTQQGMLNILLGGRDLKIDPSLFPEFVWGRLITLTHLAYFRVPDEAIDHFIITEMIQKQSPPNELTES